MRALHLRRPSLRRPAAVVAVLALAVAAGCSGEARATSGPAPTPGPAPDAAVALVVTADGLAGVPVGSSTPRWVVPGAVAAPDGSAAYAARAGKGTDDVEVLRIDPRTGAEETVGRLPGPAGLHVAAVEPGGGRVALAAPTGDATLIVDLDPATGVAYHERTFEGTLEPEAYSVDRNLLFAARIYAETYHVHGLDLRTGMQFPLLGPDKAKPPEDMTGGIVQSVLGAGGRQLATLYRDDASPDHTAFVHLLSLDSGATVCIDLHAPFGTGAPGTDALEWRDDGTVAVGHTAADPAASTTATFDPEAIWSGPPQPHYHATAAGDPSPPAVPAGIAATPGYVRFVALAT